MARGWRLIAPAGHSHLSGFLTDYGLGQEKHIKAPLQ
jgi:hypothetical protein